MCRPRYPVGKATAVSGSGHDEREAVIAAELVERSAN